MSKKMLLSVLMTLLKITAAVVIVLIVYKFSFSAYDFGYRIFVEDPVDSIGVRTASVTIVEGKTPKEIGKILEEKGLIRDGFLFIFQEMFSEYHDELQPGVYELNTGMTPFEMMQIMAGQVEEEKE
ncbi:MAG: hypothetical protein E7288_06895 [Lachnospiraceae bacterium]|nr:hypothetical protein [Lachnospiraceae bacterium]